MKELKSILQVCRSWEENKKVIEAALFIAPGTLAAEDLARLINIKDAHIAEKLLAELIEEYRVRDSGIEIFAVDGSYQMRVKPDYLDRVRHLATKAEMNKAVQRTLALIAVKQPIKQSLVIKYRNSKAYTHIKVLLNEGFIAREPTGRTYLLKTTEKFKQYFGEVKQKNV